MLRRRFAAEQDFEFLGEPIVEAARLLSRLEQHPPRLLLLDERLLDRLDREPSRTIHARLPGLRVLLLCDRECPALVEKIVRNHFHGLLTVSTLSETFVKAIRTVDRGELWLPRALLAKAIFQPVHVDRDLDALRDRSRSEPIRMLTRREAQVVDYLREGLTNKEIAVELGIMEDTVKKHLHNVFAKLGVHRRAHVILRPPGIV